MFFFRSSSDTSSVMWPENVSQTIKACFILVCMQDMLDPYLCQLCIIPSLGLYPDHNTWWNTQLLECPFPLGGNIFPAAVHAKMTVKRRFSAPVDLIRTSLHPFLLTAVDAGMPNYTGVSSMLMMSGLGKIASPRGLKYWRYFLSSFASSSVGNFCWMLVFGPKSQKKNNMLTYTITLYACYCN